MNEIEMMQSEALQVLAARENALPRITWEEFLDWCDEETHAEWVDGEVFLEGSKSCAHQGTLGFFSALLCGYAQERDLGEIISRFMMFLPSRPCARVPDLMFIARENQDRVQEFFLDGPADLVVEIISPESRDRDRGDKFFEYETAGVREYWLLDPQRRRAEWYQLQDDGAYSTAASDGEGVYHSQVLAGLWLRESWIWQPPKAVDVRREWGLI